jgi:hypothetical protein
VAYNKLHQSKSIKKFERNFEIKVKTRQGSECKTACVGMRPNLRYRLKRMCHWQYRPRCWLTRGPCSTLTPISPVQMRWRWYTTEPPYNKVKVKVTLVQALRLCTGRTAHRKWGVSITSRPLFTPGKDMVPIVQEDGWVPGPVCTGAENVAPHRDSIPGPSSR